MFVLLVLFILSSGVVFLTAYHLDATKSKLRYAKDDLKYTKGLLRDRESKFHELTQGYAELEGMLANTREALDFNRNLRLKEEARVKTAKDDLALLKTRLRELCGETVTDHFEDA